MHKLERKISRKKSENSNSNKGSGPKLSGVNQLQRQLGNRATQRLMRKKEGPTKVDEGTARQIKRERGGGHELDSQVQRTMSQQLGSDLSEVKIHTSSEANQLSQTLQAKAFTTGQDIFFKEGEYNPHSTEGQKLLAHELTHVVQQSQGRVSNGSGMTVNQPGDRHEQEANRVAEEVARPGSLSNDPLNVAAQGEQSSALPGAGVQRQEALPLQRAEEEEAQTSPLQRQEEEEAQAQEEEEAQTKEEEEKEEEKEK
jgi:hypothetical protein